ENSPKIERCRVASAKHEGQAAEHARHDRGHGYTASPEPIGQWPSGQKARNQAHRVGGEDGRGCNVGKAELSLVQKQEGGKVVRCPAGSEEQTSRWQPANSSHQYERCATSFVTGVEMQLMESAGGNSAALLRRRARRR